MKIGDLKRSGHAPSLLSAFLHFDISFMVWVILGALMPFAATDPALTGANLRVTPTAAVRASDPMTLIIKNGSDPNDYQLLIKPGPPSRATRNTVRPLESFRLDNARPETIAAVNAVSRFVRIAVAPGARGNPNENVLALQPAAPQTVANGYPAGVKLTLIAIPLLAAGFWRVLLGGLVDTFGSKRVGVASLALTLVPLVAGWKWGTTTDSLRFTGFFLGVAGASFAVALPLASRWYPPHLQGLAMGIAGAGNSGTVIATVFAPILARAFGWHAVFGLLAIPVTIVLIVFTLLARDAPQPLTVERTGYVDRYAAVLKRADAWWFCLFYFVTFGGFVGLSSFFNTFFVDQFDAPRAVVGLWTWPFIVAGSFLRPVGGALSDRWGGVRVLSVLYGVVVATALGTGLLLSHFAAVCALLFVLMGALGMGNGAVFQLVPQRFRKEIGVMTGLVGAAGGVGGYYLNFALGHLKDWGGSYAWGFWAFAGIALVALGALRAVAPLWMGTWLGTNGIAFGASLRRGEKINAN